MELNYQQIKAIEAIKSFTSKKPEIVFNWEDPFTEAVGFLVINSLKNGASGGGTRLHENVTIDEVKQLAKTMEIKFSVCKPEIGGAKSGIRIADDHPDKHGIMKRWFRAIKPILKEYYGTGSDINTDIHEINRMLHDVGIFHSQEGIFNTLKYGETGVNLKDRMAVLSNDVILKSGLSVKLSELITGYGVSESIFHFYKSSKKVLKGKKVLIQGAGNVGASVSYYLHKHGAKIVMISDKNGFFHEPKGLNTESLTQLLKSRRVDNDFNDVYPNDELLTHLENQRIDIFIPAASSNVVSKSFIDLLISRGLDIISCGANNPFIEDDLCYGQLSQYIDGRLALLPDFVANSGMARAFYKAMSSDTLLTSNDVFQDVSSMMKIVVDKCTEFEEHTSFSANAFLLALNGGFSYVNNVNLVA